MTESEETGRKVKRKLVSVVIERSGERVNVKETTSFEGVDYEAEYSNASEKSISVLVINLILNQETPKPLYSSDPAPYSETCFSGAGVLINRLYDAISFGEFGKLYSNNQVKFHIRRTNGNRLCRAKLKSSDTPGFTKEHEKLRNTFRSSPEPTDEIDFFNEFCLSDLSLEIYLPEGEFDELASALSNGRHRTVLIECDFDRSSDVFHGLGHIKFASSDTLIDSEKTIRSNVQTKEFSVKIEQALIGENSKKYHQSDLVYFPIITKIKKSRKNFGFKYKFNYFSKQIDEMGNVIGCLIVFAGATYFLGKGMEIAIRAVIQLF